MGSKRKTGKMTDKQIEALIKKARASSSLFVERLLSAVLVIAGLPPDLLHKSEAYALVHKKIAHALDEAIEDGMIATNVLLRRIHEEDARKKRRKGSKA